MISVRAQHNQFQSYLKKQKDIVSKNLKRKIFPSTTLQDYDLLKTLGQGSYGKVVAAQNVESKQIFAVKIIGKKHLVKEESLRHLLSEIRILNAVKFEFLISLECYFTNECFIFLVLPYIHGGNLLKLIRKVTRLEESIAKFFAGQVLLAIEYLHYMGIVYRDLKPENLLLDVDGYLKLVDYGFAKDISNNYSYSFCGTPEYLAPEILLNKGYNLSPDWWTFGILLYEMCCGLPPFTARNEMKLFEKILEANITYPDYFSSDLKSILTGLLQVETSKRLGCKRQKAAEVKYQKWFSQLDWTALWKKQILSPVGPIQKENVEVKNDKINAYLKNCKPIPSELVGNIDMMV